MTGQLGAVETKQAAGISPTGELSLVLAREVGKRWALHAGPVATFYGQRYEITSDSMQFYQSYSLYRGTELILLLAGARYRL